VFRESGQDFTQSSVMTLPIIWDAHGDGDKALLASTLKALVSADIVEFFAETAVLGN
jgi:hypothetical protein